MLKIIATWFIAGFIAWLFGMVTDYALYGKRYKWEPGIFAFMVLTGYATALIWLWSCFCGICMLLGKVLQKLAEHKTK